jgi:hypothetical protein
MIVPADPLGCPLPFVPDTDIDNLRMAWRDACADLRIAYHVGCQQRPSRGADAFADYVAATDREAAAADAFARGALGTRYAPCAAEGGGVLPSSTIARRPSRS